jgi:hypothetical protein
MRLQKKCYPLFGLCILLFLSCQTGKQNSQHLYTNELIHESSPYLLQHAHNPVNWYPWGEKALEKAKAEQKMLLVSVGYAACHWCHVMEKECFEDDEVAAFMNQYFVNVIFTVLIQTFLQYQEIFVFFSFIPFALFVIIRHHCIFTNIKSSNTTHGKNQRSINVFIYII